MPEMKDGNMFEKGLESQLVKDNQFITINKLINWEQFRGTNWRWLWLSLYLLHSYAMDK